jgi:hypothetical protein
MCLGRVRVFFLDEGDLFRSEWICVDAFYLQCIENGVD